MNIEELINEQKRINDILSKAKNDIEKSPEGTLRITRSKSTPCYYYRKNSSDRAGTYINAKEIDLARKLAQKGYAMDVIRYLEPMAGLIDKIVNKGYLFWNIQVNDIRNDSSLFDLQLFFEKSKYNKIKREEFDSEYSYELAVEGLYSEIMLNDIVNRFEEEMKDEEQ